MQKQNLEQKNNMTFQEVLLYNKIAELENRIAYLKAQLQMQQAAEMQQTDAESKQLACEYADYYVYLKAEQSKPAPQLSKLF